MRNVYLAGLLVVGACMSTASPQSPQNVLMPLGDNSNRVSIGCITGKCAGPALRCKTSTDTSCRRLLDCMKQCEDLPTDDEAEMCTIQCTFKYDQSPIVQKLLTCIAKNKCMNPPKVPAPACPLPNNTVSAFNVQSLEGDWWVVRGLSKAYDCWKCQSMHFKHLPGQDDRTLDYKYTFTVNDGLVKTVPATIKQAAELDGHVEVDYVVSNAFAGIDHWNVLAVSEDGHHVLVYYCGSNNGAPGVNYQGAVVMARDHTQSVPEKVMKQFEAAVAASNTGIQLDNFCNNDNTQC